MKRILLLGSILLTIVVMVGCDLIGPEISDPIVKKEDPEPTVEARSLIVVDRPWNLFEIKTTVNDTIYYNNLTREQVTETYTFYLDGGIAIADSVGNYVGNSFWKWDGKNICMPLVPRPYELNDTMLVIVDNDRPNTIFTTYKRAPK